MKAACYLRVSTSKQESDNQRADIEALCLARGFEPVWFVDEAMSGAKDSRPAYLEALEAARRGAVRAFVVWKLDRLGRKTGKLIQDVEDLAAWRCDFVSVMDRDIDTTSAGGRLFLSIMATFAQIERENTAARTKAAYQRKKARAANLGQSVKWGRSKSVVPDELVARVVRGELSFRGAAAAAGCGVATVKRRVDAFKEAQDE